MSVCKKVTRLGNDNYKFKFFKLGHTVIHFVLKTITTCGYNLKRCYWLIAFLFYFYVLLDSAFISVVVCSIACV